MIPSTIYSRTDSLRHRLNSFIQSFTSTKIDYFKEFSQEELIGLKSALSDVNNVLTLKTTLACVDWLTDFFNLSKNEHKILIDQVNGVKPNTNGYDIEVDLSKKIVVEIKCIIPINNGNYYGAAQRNSILDDAIKLKKGKKAIPDTTGFIKVIGLIDLGEKTDQAIKTLMTPSKSIRTENKSRIRRHEIVQLLKELNEEMTYNDLNKENIFIKKIKI